MPEPVGTRLDIGLIVAARDVIDPVFLDTPLIRCDALDAELGCELSLKLETANPVRSFKGRGTELATHVMRETGTTRVVCASAGNLGQALAWSGRRRGIEVTVVASRHAPSVKLERIRALGARLELVDGDHELARDTATAMAAANGVRLLEDSLDLETCEGAATIGLELAPTNPDVVLVALGGGAMATGIGHALAASGSEAERVCVQPAQAPAMTLSFRQRRVVTTDTCDTVADGVAGRRPIPAVLADLLATADDAVLVREETIVTGMRLLFERAGLVVEPSAALGIAAIVEHRERFAGRRVTTVVCGSNVDPDRYRAWIASSPARSAGRRADTIAG